jgi:hypothetical protein
MARDWQNKDWLINQYVVMGRSVASIADVVKVHPDLIRFYLDQFKIYRPLPKCQHGMVVCQKCNSKSLKI